MAKAEGRIRICGINAVQGAIAAGKAHCIYFRALSPSPRVARVLEEARRRGVRVTPLDERSFRALFRETKQGLGADVEPVRIWDIAALYEDPPHGVLLALDHWEDPQNFGAVIRSAAAFGARGVIFPSRRAAPITSTVYTASAGYIFRVPLVEVPNLRYALESLQKRGWWTVGLSADADHDISDQYLRAPIVIVVGGEGTGLSELVARTVDLRLRIPMVSGIDSLNASVAASVALYLATRTHAFAQEPVK
ncbi:MAG: 23S rRNA (guanosine(2251)-2'-O)-methyltransferase RlmB [bacterium JZ-2024 1]